MAWSKEQVQYLKDNAGKRSYLKIAEDLGKEPELVRSFARRNEIDLKVKARVRYKPEQIELGKRLLAEGKTNDEVVKNTGLSDVYVVRLRSVEKSEAKPISFAKTINNVFC